ncbi:HIT family protein [Candidatus Woesearchaeota archaeon]|nr:HIT family protein [Candidatus Woesearchaeota archaeon]
MKCGLCEIVERKQDIVYEDETLVAVALESASTIGQISVFPKQHFTILEMVPPPVLEKCAVLANKVGVAAFEALGVQGTNLLIRNGLGSGQAVPHFSIEIIPRTENDGLPLSWDPQPAPEDELEVTLALFKEELKNLKEVKQEEKQSEKQGEKQSEKQTEGESSPSRKDNYLLKSLRRVP